MTGAPSNEFQLLALLAFILPGVVHEAVLSRFRGPSPHQRDTSSRLLGALAVSTLLTIVYIAIFGFYLSDVLIRAQSSRGLVWREWLLLSGIAAAVLFIVPAVTAVARHVFVAYRLARKPQREDQGKRKSVFALYDATPTAWDHLFKLDMNVFLRIMLKDGSFIAGWYAKGSFATSYPDPHELYLSEAYAVTSDGTIGEPRGNGIWVAGDQIATIELIDPVDEEVEDGEAEQPDPGQPDALQWMASSTWWWLHRLRANRAKRRQRHPKGAEDHVGDESRQQRPTDPP